MTEYKNGQEPPPTLVKVITDNLRRLRKERGWSARELGERCVEAGLAWDRNIVANVEHGRRSNFTVAELATLAHIFNVPPLLLLSPVGFSGDVEFLSGHVADPWSIALWFSGLREFPRLRDEEWRRKYGRGEVDPVTGLHEWYDHPEMGWQTAAAPLELLKRHREQVAKCYQASQFIRQLTDPPLIDELDDLPASTLEKLRKRLTQLAERELHATRQEMRRHGLTPPPLPRELRRLDDEAGA